MGWKARPHYDKTRNCWYCQYNKKRHYLGTKEAEAYKRFAQIVGTDAPAKAPLTVPQAIEGWQGVHGGKWERWILKTWAAYASRLPLHRLGTNHLQDYLAHLQGLEQAAATIRHKVRMATRVCRWCVKNGYLENMPETPKTPKPVTRPRDVDHKSLAHTFHTLPEGAGRILQFILEIGCRPGEACRLLWSEVDLKRHICVLSEHKTAHTGQARTLYLTPAAVNILKNTPREREHVFLSRLKKPYKPNGLRSILKRHGIDTVYSLRHTRAQTMLDQGVPIEDVAKLLGHKDLSIVQTYAQVRDERARQVAHSLASPLHPEQGGRSSRQIVGAAKAGQSTRKRKKRKSAKPRVA